MASKDTTIQRLLEREAFLEKEVDKYKSRGWSNEKERLYDRMFGAMSSIANDPNRSQSTTKILEDSGFRSKK
jgi:hypothetical protein